MTADAFAGYLPALCEAGASFLGGCCGTSPEFVRALVRAAASWVPPGHRIVARPERGIVAAQRISP
jgi:homocysteine S-methyltransferase